jgi:integrase
VTLPAFGAAKLSSIGRADLQDFADRLLAQGLGASTLRNTVMPLRAIFRRALARGDIAINPTRSLELPAVRGRRDRIASPDEARALIETLPASDHALWATASYAGLRRGELMGLDWEQIDLKAGVINVLWSFDPTAGVMVAPKSRAATRRVPIAKVLRDLVDHRLRAGRSTGLAFGRTESVPFNYDATLHRARRAWKEADLNPIGLHAARHTFASFAIAAGVNAKALATYMGHASVAITFDLYGHLMPRNEEEPAARLDAYLEMRGAAMQPG